MGFTQAQIEAIDFLNEIKIHLPKDIHLEDISVNKVEKDSAYLKVELAKDESIHIHFSEDFLLFRGLFVVLPQLLQTEEMVRIEETSIKEVSFSLDASRNGVMKVPVLKKFIAYLATLGFNTLYMYTEDTYEVEGLDYFGYLRGAYSQEEIEELVQFAEKFSMEIVPSIQTLAHLTQFLKWYPVHEIRDDQNTMLIGAEKTYEAIDKMIQACKTMYKTDRIHLGMDEAYQAGLGQYLELHGYTNRTDLMIYHMNRVTDMVKAHGMKPLIWSDFIYKLLDQNNRQGLYALGVAIDTVKATELPDGLTYIHWDYGGEDVSKYEKAIGNHLEFCDLDHYTLAGGAHIWNRIVPNHGKSLKTIEASIEACRNKGVKSVMLTTWGDDGQETDHWHALLSAVNYVQAIYSVINEDEVEQIYETLFGTGTYAFMNQLGRLDEVESVTEFNSNMTNISKLLLWQDPIFGIYDYHVAKHNEEEDHSLSSYYEKLANQLMTISISGKQPNFEIIQKHYATLASVLALKAELGVDLRNNRLKEDKQALEELATDTITHLIEGVQALKETHYQMWHYTYKVNGWEVLELRYAGLISRLKTTQMKINAYLAGTESLDELLEERLPFSEYINPIEINGFNYRETSVTGYN